jgi:hypothetical protein
VIHELGRLSENALEVEQTRPHLGGQAEHAIRAQGRAKSAGAAASPVSRCLVAVSKVTTPYLQGSTRWRAQQLPLLDVNPVTTSEPFDSHEVTVATIVEDVR